MSKPNPRDAVIARCVRASACRHSGAGSAVQPENVAARAPASPLAQSGVDLAGVDPAATGRATKAGRDGRDVARGNRRRRRHAWAPQRT